MRPEPALDARLVDLDTQRDAVVHGHRQRLRATHPAEPAGQDDPAAERAVETLGRQRPECLVGPLQDPLAADIDPAAGRHLPVHDQAEPLQLPERVPGRPARHQQAVRDQHPRRVLVRPEDAHRFAGLDQERLIVFQPPQGGDDGVEGRPVARRLAGAAVDDQILGPLGDLRVQVVAEHAQGRLLLPAASTELRPSRGADRGRDAHPG